MAKTNHIITNFSAGELSGFLDGRVDIARYYNGAKLLENFIVLPYGGAMRRPGTYYVASTKGDGIARLIPFMFSTTAKQAYALEFGNLYMRVFMNNGIVGAPYELPTDYLEADLFDLQFSQSADVMWITHPKYKTRKLTRAADDNWSIVNYVPVPDPFGADGSDDCPSCVAFFENRLCFANTNNNPQKVWGTDSGDYEKMTVGVGDGDRLEYTIASELVNEIRWLKSGKKLLMGTFGGAFAMSSGEEGVPVTPTNITIKKATEYGSINIVPHRIGNYVYFVQRNARTIREMAFDFNIDEYKAKDMTILSEHIVKNSIVDMDYQQSPYNILWCVRNDGVLLSFTREADQEVMAWARHILGGSFGAGDAVVESVAVIPGDGGDDEVWVVVKRTIDGNTVRYVEYFKPFDSGSEQEDAFFVDSGLSQDTALTITAITKANPGVVTTSAAHGLANGNIVIIRGVKGMTEVNQIKYKVANKTGDTFELTDPDTDDDVDTSGYTTYISGGEARLCTTTLGGLGHLEGEALGLLLDGSKGVGKTVSGSSITLDSADGEAGEIHAGLPYTSILQTLRIEAGSIAGTAQAKMKRITRIFVRVHESVGMHAGNADVQDEIDFREAGDDTDKPIPLKSGDKDVLMPSSWDRDAYIKITQSDPLPLNVLAIIAKLGVTD